MVNVVTLVKNLRPVRLSLSAKSASHFSGVFLSQQISEQYF
jgi:hypothetical protein